MSATLASLLHRLRRLAAPPDADADAALLERFVRRRDEGAFAALVARHGPMVRNVCRRVLGDAHLSDDAFQATFLVLARRAGAVRRPASLAGWLHGVASRVAREARRRRALRPLAGLAEAPEPPDPRPDPLAVVTARDLVAVLEEEVGRLPAVYRLAVVLVCLEGLSQEEAAKRLGWTAGQVRGRLERGRKRLHARLAQRGLALSAALGAVEVARGAAAVPPPLSGMTVKAAAAFAAGDGVTAGPVSADAVALTEEVLRAMRITKVKVALATTLVLLGCAAGLLVSLGFAQAPAAPAGQKAEPEPARPGAAPGSPVAVSLIQLIATPREFDGKYVRVHGFVKIEHEGTAVYLHREDCDHMLTRNGLWLACNDAAPAGSDEANVNNRYALIEGQFQAGERGHRGLWSGSLRRITRMIPWEIRKGGK